MGDVERRERQERERGGGGRTEAREIGRGTRLGAGEGRGEGGNEEGKEGGEIKRGMKEGGGGRRRRNTQHPHVYTQHKTVSHTPS